MNTGSFRIMLALFPVMWVCVWSSPLPAAPWQEILTAESPRWPAPRPKVEWINNWRKGMEAAQRENRPLFITFRCLPCKQCADFDRDVLEGGPKLDPLLRQFVTVRATNAEHLDFRLFPPGFQDYDLSWWGFFLSPEGKLYGVFGGKDHLGASTRISVDALANTLRRVLDHHYHPQREQWDIDGPTPNLKAKGVKWAFDLPGWPSYRDKHMPTGQGCLHCHQVAEIMRQPALDAGTFDKQQDLAVWPLPENVGVELDRDHGLRVKKVEPGSPAAKAGLKAGDVLGAADGRKLFGQADFRGVLHRGPAKAGRIDLVWLRDGKLMTGSLAVAEGWRKTQLEWRMSVSQGNIGAGPGFFPLSVNEQRRRALGIDAEALAIVAYMPKRQNAATAAGLRHNDVIVAVNGESPDVVGRAFLTWFRLRYNPGDKVTLTVADGPDKRRKVTYTLGAGE